MIPLTVHWMKRLHPDHWLCGDIEYDQSSISVTVARYVTYNEDTLKADGTLDNMTFDEFVTQNNNRVKGTRSGSLYYGI